MKKRGFNVKAHPLTVIAWCVFLLLGRPINVIAYFFVLLGHEYLHYFVAKKLNVPLDDVVMTPFGGCLKGELLGIRKEKTLAITLIPPIINLITSAIIFALWWISPTLYPYTEMIAYANLSVGAINLLPCYPLDGGRAVISMFNENEKFGRKMITAFSVMVSIIMLVLFVFSCISKSINISYLTMSIFILFGAFYEERTDYIKLRLSSVLKKKKKGILPIKCVYVESFSDYELLSILSNDCYHIFFRKNGKGELYGESEEDFLKRIKNK